MKLSKSSFLLFIFIPFVSAHSADSGIHIYSDKDSFIGWVISTEISKLGKKLTLLVKSVNQSVNLNNQSIWQQFWQLIDRLIFFYWSFLARSNLQHSAGSQDFHVLEFYYPLKKLNNTSLNYGRKYYYCNSTHPF